MKQSSQLRSAVNLALHNLKHVNSKNFQKYDTQVDQLLKESELQLDVILEPSMLQSLLQLQKHDCLKKILDKESGLRSSNRSLQYLYGELAFRQNKIKDALAAWSVIDKNDSTTEFLRIRIKQLIRYPEMVLGNSLLYENEPEVHVLLLTKDRELYLQKTLDCLRKTNYSNYKVFIVDNGSKDTTHEYLQHISDKFPSSIQVTTQSLPTNIGRPAGHNWLLTNWDHSSADYIVILDDDLLHFSPNWIRLFLNSFRLKPDIAAVGGKTIGKDLLIQDSTSVILPPDPVTGSVNFFTNCGAFDWGQFDYMSNVSDYIIGCASMFKREVFETVGLFDIRFSPSQGVDIDHGLRMRQYGYDLLYNGNCTFVHAQLNSENLDKDRSRRGNSLGNFLKLGYKFTPEEFREIIESRQLREQCFAATEGIF